MKGTEQNPAESKWKTKEVEGRRMMICMNSKPEDSKWGDYAPEDGDCTNWTEVGHNTTASLCSECTARSVNF